MTLIGALARVDPSSAEVVQGTLAAMPGITPFPVDDSARLGLLIEAATLDDAYRLLCDDLQSVKGVLAVWPVYVDFEEQSQWN